MLDLPLLGLDLSLIDIGGLVANQGERTRSVEVRELAEECVKTFRFGGPVDLHGDEDMP